MSILFAKPAARPSCLWGALTAFLALFFVLSMEGHAQCTPDCPGSVWSAPTTRNIVLFHQCPGCVIEVTYVIREACGTWQDLQITEIEIISGCGACNFGEIVQAAFEALIMSNPPLFDDPEAGECANTWRVSIAGCFNEWIVTFPGGGTGTFLLPCEGDACCMTRFRVCRDSTGAVSSITQFGDPAQAIDCDSARPRVGTGPCFSTCEFTNLGFGKGSVPRGYIDTDNANRINHAIAVPNPVVGSRVEFGINTSQSGSAKLAIYDMKGVRVQEVEVELTEGETRISVDIGNLQAGTYLYELSASGHLLVTDKLIIGR